MCYVKQILISICTLFLISLQHSSAYTEELKTTILTYTIKSTGKSVGQIVVTKTGGGNMRTTDSITELNLTPLQVDYTFTGRSKVQYTGTLCSSFDHWLIDQKKQWHLSGKRMDKGLWVGAYKVKNRSQNDIDDIIHLTSTVAAQTIPNAGLVMTILSLFSTEVSEGEEEIPFDYYNTTDLELPFYLLQLIPWKGIKKIKVFYTDTMERKIVTIRYLNRKKLPVADTFYNCKGFEINSKTGKSTLWLAMDKNWGAVVVEQTDMVNKHSLLIRLESVGTGRWNAEVERSRAAITRRLSENALFPQLFVIYKKIMLR